jgi:hypothetical protein
MLQWWYNKLDAWQHHLLPCPFKWITGCDCPACGSQRSAIQLLHGEFLKSWQINPLVPGFMLLVVFRVAAPMMGLTGWPRLFRLGSYLLALVVVLIWILKLFQTQGCI